ncbi:MAG: 50S ribosomal protein L22 [Bacteroidales bacterium]|jgi:large subunit ribosomal protein L22|nr:50S ribosomal protein L22 [Bacteroidales bacterium]MBR4715928.1 50S ribosomal protein L22 [Bacteroidales bacterium]MCR4930976.1 50S ribosomal protein L22 [Bacteroidales bacterium]
MGRRKHNSAEARKEANKTYYVAKLMNNPTSPRKTRLVADLIRGVDVDKALAILQFNPRESAPKMRKLLLSAIANWQAKNEGKRIEDSQLYVKTVMVDEGRTMKRMRTAPQGRGYRIRKRSNHITMVVGSRVDEAPVATNAQTEE